MKIHKDSAGKTTISFEKAQLPGGENIENLLKKNIDSSLIVVLREFGAVGLSAYVGGFLVLFFVPLQKDINQQLLILLSGLFLISLSVFIAYFRIKAERDREQSLIGMVQSSGDRLSEQLGMGMGKGITEKQVSSITQTIWQNQKDLITAILKDR